MLIYNSDIMRNLMMDLLDLAQMENCTFKLNKSYFNITEVIQKSFNIVNHIANLKKVKLV